MTDDPELEVIGAVMKACGVGRAARLDKKAWRRIADYTASLFAQHAREAAVAEKVETEAPPPVTASPDPLLLMPRRVTRREKRKEGWHVLGRHPRRQKLDA